MPLIKELWQKNEININQCDEKYTTALHIAAQIGDEDIMQFLLNNQPELNGSLRNIDRQDINGNTAMHFATIFGNTIIIDLLIKIMLILLYLIHQP